MSRPPIAVQFLVSPAARPRAAGQELILPLSAMSSRTMVVARALAL
jgi:hypothetical protein